MEIRNDPEHRRYVVEVDGEVVGKAVYERRDDRVVFTHTEIDDSLEGQGVGSKLASFALEDVRAQGGKVVPLCPFIARYIERHDQYADLVDTALADELRASP